MLQTVGVEQVQYIPQERDQQRTVEQIIGVFAPPAVEDIVEVTQDRISACIVEQIISVPVLLSLEETVEGVMLDPARTSPATDCGDARTGPHDPQGEENCATSTSPVH